MIGRSLEWIQVAHNGTYALPGISGWPGDIPQPVGALRLQRFRCGFWAGTAAVAGLVRSVQSFLCLPLGEAGG